MKDFYRGLFMLCLICLIVLGLNELAHMSAAQASTNRPVPLATDGVVLTKSDTTVISCNQWYVGGTGNANVTTADGNAVLFSSIPAGTIIPLAIRQLLSTSTTVTLVVCLK